MKMIEYELPRELPRGIMYSTRSMEVDEDIVLEMYDHILDDMGFPLCCIKLIDPDKRSYLLELNKDKTVEYNGDCHLLDVKLIYVVKMKGYNNEND